MKVNRKAAEIGGVRWLIHILLSHLTDEEQALTGVLTWTAESRLLVTAAFPKACLGGGGDSKSDNPGHLWRRGAEGTGPRASD